VAMAEKKVKKVVAAQKLNHKIKQEI